MKRQPTEWEKIFSNDMTNEGLIGEGNGNPLQYSCLDTPHGQKILAGYSPWGRKELDTTKQLTHT